MVESVSDRSNRLSSIPAPGALARCGSLIDPANCPSSVHSFDREAEIIADGDAPAYCYQIVSGCVRTVKLLEDGRRQVGEFLFAGDIFGWEASGHHAFAVEAVDKVTVQRFRLAAVEALVSHDRGFARRLQAYIVAQVRIGRERMVLLGRNTAAERVSAFLLDMHARLNGAASPVLDLPMGRVDIGDYLGLTVETVCRTLSTLRRAGCIAADGTRIVIRNRNALRPVGSTWLN